MNKKKKNYQNHLLKNRRRNVGMKNVDGTCEKFKKLKNFMINGFNS